MSSLSYETISSILTASDESHDLVLFSNQTSPDVKPPLDDQPVRGVIFDKDHDEIVVPGSYYTKEVTPANCGLSFPTTVYTLPEGTMLRVFFYKRQWRISTYRKLDAFESYWSGRKSFGQLFEDALREQFNMGFSEFCQRELHPHNQYLFLLHSNSDNYIVSKNSSQETKMTFVGYYEQSKFSIENPLKVSVNTLERKEFDTVDQLQEALNNLDVRSHSGFVHIPQNGPVLKFTSQSYLNLFELRGNVSNLLVRYLQLKSEEPGLMEAFLNLYESHSEDFKYLESVLTEAKQFIHQVYKYRYILKQQIQVPPHLFYLVRLCHSWYFEDPSNRKVTLKVVSDILDKQTSNTVYRLYKDFS